MAIDKNYTVKQARNLREGDVIGKTGSFENWVKKEPALDPSNPSQVIVEIEEWDGPVRRIYRKDQMVQIYSNLLSDLRR